MIALYVSVDDPSDLSGFIVLDPQDLTLRTHLKLAGRLTFRNFGVERRPLRI